MITREKDTPVPIKGEAWPIFGELGRLYAQQGEMVQAREAYQEGSQIIHHLAETIVDEDLRRGFLAADPVRSVSPGNRRRFELPGA